VKRIKRSRWRRSLRKELTLALSVSLVFALLVSLSPCCQIFSGLVIPVAQAAVDHGAATHDHHDHSTPDDRGGAPAGHGPCSLQIDLTFVVPDLATTATTPQLDDGDVAITAVSSGFRQQEITRNRSVHSPPPLGRPLYLRFVRLIE